MKNVRRYKYTYRSVMTGSDPQHRKCFRVFLVVWAFMENLLFSGLRAGWPALVYILKQEGVYQHLCNTPDLTSGVLYTPVTNTSLSDIHALKTTSYNRHSWINSSYLGSEQSLSDEGQALFENTQDILFRNSTGFLVDMLTDVNTSVVNLSTTRETNLGCEAQDAVFNQCFTVASATMALCGLLFGQLNYMFGIRVPRVLFVILFSLGCVCIAFNDKDSPWLVFPGLLLVSSGGMALYITNNQVSYMFPTGGAAVVGLLCGGLEASSFVMTAVKIAYEQGVSMPTLFLSLGGASAVTLVSTFLFLPKKFIGEANKKDTMAGGSVATDNTVRSGDPPPEVYVVNDNDRGSRCLNDVNVYTEIQLGGDPKTQGLTMNNKRGTQMQSIKTTKTRCFNFKSDRTKGLAKCFCSWTFCLYLLWAAVVQLVLTMCLGTFNPWLDHVTAGDTEQVSLYTDVLLYSMLASPVLATSIGLAMDCLQRSKQGADVSAKRLRTMLTTALSLSTTSVLAVLVCACVMAMDFDLIAVTCVTLVVFRNALYSSGTGFIRLMYPTEYFGILCGVMSLLAGAAGFVQYPMFLWVQSEGQAWWEVFGLLSILGVVSLAAPVYIYWKGRQQAKNVTIDS